MELLDRRCEPLFGLWNSQTQRVARKVSSVVNIVKAVVQVVGHSKVPAVPKYSEELRSWYLKVN